VVEKAIETTPRSFNLYDRAGKLHAELGGNNVHFVPGSSGLKMLDHHTKEVRHANTADFVDYVRLCDGLEHIAYLATGFSTNDIEEQVSDAWRLYLSLTIEDLPTIDLVRDLLAEEHMITSPHTLKHWPQQLYMPSHVIDRQNRENWVKAGAHTLEQRATAEVETRLAAYTPPENRPTPRSRTAALHQIRPHHRRPIARRAESTAKTSK